MSSAGNDVAAAKILEALQADREPTVRAEAHFRLGQLRERQGDLAAAADQYRAILAEQPSANPVRLALARVLAALGHNREARSLLHSAAHNGLPPDVVRAVSAFGAVLRSQRDFGLIGEITARADSNVNQATARETVDIAGLPFDLTPDARAQGDIGLASSARLFWRPQVLPRLRIVGSASGSIVENRQGRFDDLSGGLSIGPEYETPTMRIQLSGSRDWRRFDGQAYSTGYGISLNILRPIDDRSRITLDLTRSWARYVLNAAQNGHSLGISIGYERQFGSALAARISIYGADNRAAAEAFANRIVGGNLLLSWSRRAFSLYESTSYYRIKGRADFAFPPVGRADNLVEVEGGVQIHALDPSGRFTPLIRVRRSVNRSPVFFYDYRQWRAEAGLSIAI